MTEAEEILLGPARFGCDRFRCNMLRTDCVAQQIRAADKGNTGKQGANHPAYRCKNCEQGKRIIEAERLKEKGIIVPIKKEEIKRDPEGQSIKEDDQYKITLDFSKHKPLFGKIVAEAEKKFRNPRGQIMAMVNRYFDDLMAETVKY